MAKSIKVYIYAIVLGALNREQQRQTAMLVTVDIERCNQVGDSLVSRGLPLPVEPWASASTDVDYDLATLNLVIVSVCHQTQRLAGTVNGIPLRGWDFLQTSFQQWASLGAGRTTPERLAAFTASDLRELLAADGRVDATDYDARATFVGDCGKVLLRLQAKSFSDLYLSSGRSIVSLLEVLSEFAAFNDPVRKKSLFLLGLNGATCGWEFCDPDLLDPPVDYHEVRGHLRLGTVRIIDSDLLSLVRQGNEVEQSADIAIRTAVTQAIRQISRASSFTPMQLHYAFWNLFRSICLRQQPICRGNLIERLPEAYQHLVEGGACCFVECCDSSDQQNAIDEHRFATDWY